MTDEAPPPLPGEPNAQRLARGRTLAAWMLILVAALIVHHVVVFAQSPPEKRTATNLVPIAAMNVLILGVLIWLAIECRNGRRIICARIAVFVLAAMIVAVVALSLLFAISYRGSSVVVVVQASVVAIVAANCVLAVRAHRT